ncbi:hypothetical protein [Priestia megaterium]|uniref:hypothetical protein n=1 Tax=Priestia megaterium TaxID=1404 RepID=UPI00345A5847
MRFTELSKEMQLKVRMFEAHANELGKDSPECRELWLELQKEPLICGALNQKDGEFSACLRSPVEGRNRCGLHGGKTLKGDQLTPAHKLAQMKNLRPDAHFIHGLYAEESTFVNSLTEGELQFMTWLDSKVREQYEVEEGVGDVILEGMKHDAVLHFRMLNKGQLERGSKHTTKPLQDLMKACKDMGWIKKTAGETRAHKTTQALADLLALADTLENDEDDKPIIN